MYFAAILLTKERWAIVDLEDFYRVDSFNWCAHNTSRGTKWYAVRATQRHERERWKSVNIRLHHFVLDVAPSELPEFHVVDHRNHDSLDCRKANLEIVTQTVNMERSQNWKRKKVTADDLFL